MGVWGFGVGVGSLGFGGFGVCGLGWGFVVGRIEDSGLLPSKVAQCLVGFDWGVKLRAFGLLVGVAFNSPPKSFNFIIRALC